MLNSLANSLQKLLPCLALRSRSPGCGDAASRAVNHKILYDSLGTKNGPARGVLGLDQFIEWAGGHVLTQMCVHVILSRLCWCTMLAPRSAARPAVRAPSLPFRGARPLALR